MKVKAEAPFAKFESPKLVNLKFLSFRRYSNFGF